MNDIATDTTVMSLVTPTDSRQFSAKLIRLFFGTEPTLKVSVATNATAACSQQKDQIRSLQLNNVHSFTIRYQQITFIRVQKTLLRW